jgi:hypothetical protein
MGFDNIGDTLFTVGFAVFLIACAIAGLICLVGLRAVGSTSGEQTGYITAVERNSNLLFSANIVYVKTDTESTQEDEYCVNDLELKANLEQLSKEKAHITISFSRPFLMWAWKCNGGDAIITGVDYAK